jgi:hypothetical protein
MVFYFSGEANRNPIHGVRSILKSVKNRNSIMHGARQFFLSSLLVVAGLAGCATPQYRTDYRYEPPADAQGLSCVHECGRKKDACQADCKARYQACQKEVEPLVEERYLRALKQYENDLRQYALALRQYEIQQWMYWPYDYWPHHRGYYYYPWPGPYFPPPYPPPGMPTREGVRAALENQKCQADCGCLPAYDTCYVNCGGRRIAETVCIRNCEKTAPRQVQ